MKSSTLISILLIVVNNCGEGVADGLDVITTKSGLTSKLRYKFMFPLKEVVGPSLSLALTACQANFKWERWNCPSNDFLTKRASKHFDRESAYVMTITTAALMYTITKNCSSGHISGCGCAKNQSNEFIGCSDNLKYAEETIGLILHSRPDDSLDVQAYAALHNERLARLLLRRSLRRFCRCDGEELPCNERCWYSLRPFGEIAKDIRIAYDKALIVNVDNKGEVTWKHIPADVLVYVADSPNYCNSNAIPGWTGTRGRLCSRKKGKNVSLHERLSCRNLCRTCGLRVRGQSVMRQTRCNCRFSWCCEVRCDTCVQVEKQHYCD